MSDVLELNGTAATDTTTELCPCGSGLKQQRCCGLDLARVERTPADGAFAEQLGTMTEAYNAGDVALARTIALEVLDEAPGQRDALGALYNVLKDANDLKAAGVIVERVALLYPNDAVARVVAAQFFLIRNDLPRAQQHSRMLVRLAPEAPVSQFTMGRTFMAVSNPVAAEVHFRRAMDLSPTHDVEVEANLGMALRDQGRLDEAREIFSRLMERGPNLTIFLAWAALEEADRNFDAAARLLDRAEKIAPGGPRIAIQRANLHRRAKQPELALEALDHIDERFKAAGEGGPALQEKGQILDALGRYDEAFEAFESFKRRQREVTGHAYQATYASNLVARLRGFFTESRTKLLPRAETRSDSPQPVFIVGFPRSGTTLVEQILTSHPNIAAGDELPIINTMTDRIQMLLGSPGAYPLALSELWLGDRSGHINTLRDLYLNEAARIGAIDPAKGRFTDKMPLNETHLGLISLLFPQSPVVHLVRHPLDVVLSVFSNGLTHGYYCAYALETAAQHYALIAELILHYRAVMPINYRAVRYEDLVTDNEQEVRGLFGFIGETFDPRVLDFQDNSRHARTASYAQVTEKLYDRSRYRYRNYLKHLEPVIPILQPAIDRLGYTI